MSVVRKSVEIALAHNEQKLSQKIIDMNKVILVTERNEQIRTCAFCVNYLEACKSSYTCKRR
jgi:hypothetical protein